jgi:hypothetical protein
MGPNKRKLAASLYQRMKARYAPQGLAHFGQGKWYPGEQLPRWSLNCYWRKDGEPIWANPKLIADENKNYAVTEAHARLFLARVAAELGFDAKYIFAAYEDAFYYLWRERRCRRMSIPSTRSSRIRWSARVWPRCSSRAWTRHRPCAAGGAHGRRPALADGTVVPAQRALLLDSGRFAHRLSPAARFAALDRDRRLSFHSCAGSVAGFAPLRRMRKYAGSFASAMRRVRRPSSMRGRSSRSRRRRSRARRCAQAAQRRALHLHAAGARARSLSGVGRGGGGGGRGALQQPDGHRGLRAAQRSASRATSR